MNEPATGSGPLKPLLGVFLAIVALLLAAGWLKGYHDLSAARQRERELAAGIEAAEERIHALRRHIRRVEEDPVTLEYLAREELGLARPGDVVILLPGGGPPAVGAVPGGQPPAASPLPEGEGY